MFVLLVVPEVAVAQESGSASHTPGLLQNRDAVAIHPVGNADWAFSAEDVRDEEKITERGNAGDSRLVPASLVKLFVTGAFAELSEVPLRMSTIIAMTGKTAHGILKGNIVIKGGGNPFLSTTDLQSVIEKMKSEGLNHVAGNLVLDDTLLEITPLQGRHEGPAYSSAAALGLDLHSIAVTVEPATEGKPPKVNVEPPNSEVRVAVSALTLSLTPGTIEVKQLDDLSYQVTGVIPVKSAPFRRRFALVDPALYAAATFKTVLEKAGITVQGGIKRARMTDTATVVATIPGPDFKQVLHDMNVNSLNVVADTLQLLLGAERYGAPGTREKGVQAVRQFLAELDLPMDQVVLSDGSGLSEQNRVTPSFMTHYLRSVAKKRWFPAFRSSLPRAGYEGTVRDLAFHDSRFRVKTGVLKNVLALAGYGVDAGGREIAFTYIVNGPGAGLLPLEPVGGDVLRYLANEVHL